MKKIIAIMVMCTMIFSITETCFAGGLLDGLKNLISDAEESVQEASGEFSVITDLFSSITDDVKDVADAGKEAIIDMIHSIIGGNVIAESSNLGKLIAGVADLLFSIKVKDSQGIADACIAMLDALIAIGEDGTLLIGTMSSLDTDTIQNLYNITREELITRGVLTE